MTNEKASVIIGNIPVYGDECYSIAEYQEAKTVAVQALLHEPKPGYWTRELIRNEKGGCIGAKMICSRCGNDNKHDEYMSYCPNCGVSMVESQESDIEKRKPCSNYEDGCEEWAGCPCVYYKEEIEQVEINGHIRDVECFRAGINATLNVIDKYKTESEEI